MQEAITKLEVENDDVLIIHGDVDRHTLQRMLGNLRSRGLTGINVWCLQDGQTIETLSKAQAREMLESINK